MSNKKGGSKKMSPIICWSQDRDFEIDVITGSYIQNRPNYDTCLYAMTQLNGKA